MHLTNSLTGQSQNLEWLCKIYDFHRTNFTSYHTIIGYGQMYCFICVRKPIAKNLTLTLPVPCISESCIKIKINLNFYFHTSLWCLKSFYEGPKGLFPLHPGSGCEGLRFLGARMFTWNLVQYSWSTMSCNLPSRHMIVQIQQ